MKKLVFLLSFALVCLISCDPLEEPCDFTLCVNGECIDGTCECENGFTGANCETDACENIICQNNGTCVNGTCNCPIGFSGPNCETVVDPCNNVSCQNGGTCNNNGTCDCPTGFTGSNCETIVNACDNVSCQNGGTCVDGTCDCPEGFSGPNCQIDACDNTICLNGGSCINGACDCPDGFTGPNCEQVDPCLTIICNNDGVCEDGQCNCPPNYAGTLCDIYTPPLFQGFWEAADNCDSQQIDYITGLTVDQINDLMVEVGEFGEFGSSQKFTAIIDGLTITIERIQVEPNVFLSATGIITTDGSAINWVYNIERTDAGVVDSCTGLWKKI